MLHREDFIASTTQSRSFSLEVPAGNYAVRCVYPPVGTSLNSPMTIRLELSLVEVRRTAFHTSFEYETVGTVNQSKTGNRCWQGIYRVLLPPQAGTYVLSYWTKPVSGGQWQFNRQSIAVTGATDRLIGDDATLLDEVRLHPAGAQMTTATYHPIFGKTSETDPNGLTTYYEYDGLGRPTVVRNHRRDILRANSYNTKL